MRGGTVTGALVCALGAWACAGPRSEPRPAPGAGSAAPSVVWVAPTEADAGEQQAPAPTAARVGTWLPVIRADRTAVALSADCLGSAEQPQELVVEHEPAAGKELELIVATFDDRCEEAAAPRRLGLSRDPKGEATRHCTGWLLTSCGQNHPELAVPRELSPQIYLASWEWQNALRSLRETADGLGEAPPDPKRLTVSLGDDIRVAYPPGATVFTFGRDTPLRIDRHVHLLTALGRSFHAVVLGRDGLFDVLALKDGRAAEELTRRVPRFVDREDVIEEDPFR